MDRASSRALRAPLEADGSFNAEGQLRALLKTSPACDMTVSLERWRRTHAVRHSRQGNSLAEILLRSEAAEHEFKSCFETAKMTSKEQRCAVTVRPAVPQSL